MGGGRAAGCAQVLGVVRGLLWAWLAPGPWGGGRDPQRPALGVGWGVDEGSLPAEVVSEAFGDRTCWTLESQGGGDLREEGTGERRWTCSESGCQRGVGALGMEEGAAGFRGRAWLWPGFRGL